MAKYTLVSTVKDEGPYLLEWLAYHSLIGFNQFHISANNCSDHTDEILQLFQQQGLIIYNDNTERGEYEPHDPQRRAYRRAKRTPSVDRSDYVAVIDGDEFFNILAGDGTLKALFDETGEFDLISPVWRVFGTGGQIKFKEGLQIEQFTRTARPFFPPEVRFWGIKTMFRPKHVVKYGVHRPLLLQELREETADPLIWLNGSGEDVYENFFKRGWFSTRAGYGDKLIRMNHYILRSSEAFLMKRMRGTANTVNQERINFDYFETFNQNQKRDVSIQRHASAIRRKVEDWCDTIPGLYDLHMAAVHYHRSRIAVARADLEANNPDIAVALGLMDEKETT